MKSNYFFYRRKAFDVNYICYGCNGETKIIPNRFVLGNFKINGELKEIRIYTDTAKTRLYKPGIVSKINNMIEKTGNLTLDNLPKRIRKKVSKHIKISFITVSDNKYVPVNDNDLPFYDVWKGF